MLLTKVIFVLKQNFLCFKENESLVSGVKGLKLWEVPKTWGELFLTDSNEISTPKSQYGDRFVMVKILIYVFFPILNEL